MLTKLIMVIFSRCIKLLGCTPKIIQCYILITTQTYKKYQQ